MGTLKEFELVSGLKVNTEKTKIIEIGGIRDNRINLCTDLKLIWTNKFTYLGITYDVQDMENITEQNIALKEKEIHKLINAWTGRNVTPLGKIILIKSLLISKITHILLSLPTPKEQTFQKLDNIFGNFIWQGKPPKLRKEILESTYTMGGLKKTNLKIFDQSLKLSWLKRFKDSSDGWEEIPRKFNIQNIPIFGDKYPSTILKKINKGFWKDVLIACESFQKKFFSITLKTYNIPLWFNSKINISFRKEWFNMGYYTLSDILDINGNIVRNEDLARRGLTLNFLEYERIRFDLSKIDKRQDIPLKMGPQLLYIFFKMGHNVKGCAKTYKILMEFNHNIVASVKDTRETNLNEYITLQCVENSFRNLHNMKEGAYTKYIQFKLLHRRIVTNKKLCDMGIKENSMCTYCLEEVETIEQAFLHCNAVTKLWKEVEAWLRLHVDVHISLNNVDKILGTPKGDNLVYKTIMATKKIIYRNRQKGSRYSLKEVQISLRSQMNIEEYQSIIENSFTKFLDIWEPVYDLL